MTKAYGPWEERPVDERTPWQRKNKRLKAEIAKQNRLRGKRMERMARELMNAAAPEDTPESSLFSLIEGSGSGSVKGDLKGYTPLGKVYIEHKSKVPTDREAQIKVDYLARMLGFYRPMQARLCALTFNFVGYGDREWYCIVPEQSYRVVFPEHDLARGSLFTTAAKTFTFKLSSTDKRAEKAKSKRGVARIRIQEELDKHPFFLLQCYLRDEQDPYQPQTFVVCRHDQFFQRLWNPV